ncbi:eukaryotic translation initiation factor 5 [Ceratobasidium sp. AG-Ba]|nr:eukaryotic translation initiation factor 5 [Ceratobasidium sp. AG-Ba]
MSDPTAATTEEPLFDPSLKKKKKKKVMIEEDPLGADGADEPPAPAEPVKKTEVAPGPSILKPAPPTAAVAEDNKPAEDDLNAMFGDLKKKKKKKTEIPLDLDLDETATPASGDATPAAGDDPNNFEGLKKKKKSSGKKAAFDMEAFEKELAGSAAKPKEGDDEDEEGADEIKNFDEGDLGEDVFAQPTTGDGGVVAETWLGTDRDYTYPELLGRFYQILRAQNPELAGEKRRYTIVPPSVHRDGNKKTVFANIGEICKRMHRQPDHVIQFLFAELGTTGSVDGSQRLVIKGRFQPKQLENVLRRYIVEYVTCKTCKSPDTILTKENRIYFMSCESCGSRRSVSAIKAGFQAQVGKRSRTKAAT